MPLEDIIYALSKVMKNEVRDEDASLLQSQEVAPVLTTYFNEVHARPELTSLIKPQTLMYEYLSLPLEERETVERFRIENPEYLKGDGGENIGLKMQKLSENVRESLKKISGVAATLKLFNFFIEKRKNGDMFIPGFFLRKESECNRGVHNNILKHLKKRKVHDSSARNGLEQTINLVAELRPEIKEYTYFKGVCRIDVPKRVAEIFEFYLNNDFGKMSFNSRYIEKKFPKDKGYALFLSFRRIFKKEGDIKYLLKLAEKFKPSIAEHWRYRTIFRPSEPEMANLFIKAYKHWETYDRERVCFSPAYFSEKSTISEIGVNLSGCVYSKLGGDWSVLMKKAAEKEPTILKDWSYLRGRSFSLEETVKIILSGYDHWKKYEKEKNKTKFRPSFFRNEHFNEVYQNAGMRILKWKNRGYFCSWDEIIEVAFKTEPGIKEHWSQRRAFSLEYAVQVILAGYRHWREHGQNLDYFSPIWLRNKHFNELNHNAGENVLMGIYRDRSYSWSDIINPASRVEPEILKDWSVQKRILNMGSSIYDISQEFLSAYDNWRESGNNNEKFNPSYFRKTKSIIRKIVYSRFAGNWNLLVEEAAKIRPEIKENWSYNPEFSNKKKKSPSCPEKNPLVQEAPVHE